MLKVTSLRDFDPPTFDDETSAGLLQDVPVFCKKQDLQDETQPFFTYIKDMPITSITQDMLATRESARTIGPENLFLPVQDSIFKKIVSIWRERGFLEAIRSAAAERSEQIAFPVHWVATQVTRFLDLLERGTFRTEGLPSSGSGSVADVAATRDWASALVRCMSWHPQCAHLAVATRDDRIRVFSNSAVGVPILRHSAQKSVCCLSWRPYAGRELAAACQSGVLIWTVELGAASNSLSHATLLKHRNHSPVTSVAWHPQGDLLVSCCLTDLNMMIWDVSKETGVPLRRLGGSGLCFSKWSLCGSRLLATSCRTTFRVWNVGKGEPWTAEKWTVPSGRIAAACFGPNLSLLFTSTENPATVFSLPLQEQIFETKNSNTSDHVKTAIQLIDLSRVVFFENENEQIPVGGRVIAMDWDTSGKYLAIIFQDSPFVAIFKTKPGPTSRIGDVKPGHLVQGFSGEVPNCIQFYQNQKKNCEAIILTIAWSSGRMQNFPIVNEIKSVSVCQTQNYDQTFMTASNMQSTIFPQSPYR